MSEREDFAGVVGLLKARREALGLSGEEVSLRAGVARTMVSRWERGVYVPSAVRFIAWAAVLGLTVEVVDSEPG